MQPRTRYVTIATRMAGVALMFGLSVRATAQAQAPAAPLLDSLRVQLDRAVAALDTVLLAKSEQQLDRALMVYPTDARLLHYRGYAAYRHAVLAFIAGQPSVAGTHLDQGAKWLEKSSQTLEWPETYMLQAAVAGMQIGVDQSRAMELGQLSMVFADRAKQTGADNPRVLLLQAWAARKTPPEYGGGVDKAKLFVQRAMEKFLTDHPAPLAPSWGREEAASLARQLGANPGGDGAR